MDIDEKIYRFELSNVSLSTRNYCYFNSWNEAEGKGKYVLT